MSPPQVLLAEDDVELRRLLCDVLKKKGYSVTEAESGDDLLQRLWERSHDERPFDLIVSDIRMPGLSGLEVLDGLRDDFEPCIGETPVILITAFGDAEVHDEAKKLGAVLFDKPFDVDELIGFAAAVLRHARASGGLH